MTDTFVGSKMIDELFPYKKDGKASYRVGQKEAIEKAIQALLIQDYDVFFIDAPVGYGKCIRKGTKIFGDKTVNNIELPQNLVFAPLSNTLDVVGSHIISGKKEVVSVETRCGYTLSCTPDHLLAVLESGKIKWVKASDSKGKYVLISKHILEGQDTVIEVGNMVYNITEELAEYLGFWLADGSVSYDKRQKKYVSQKLHKNDLDYIYDLNMNVAKIFRRDVGYTYKKPGIDCYDVSLYYPAFSCFLVSNFGSDSLNKHLPDFVYNMPLKMRAKFLRGYLAGDGCIDDKSVSFCTSSKRLESDLKLLLLTMGISCSYSRTKKTSCSDAYEVYINSRDLSLLWSYTGEFKGNDKFSVLLSKKRNPNIDVIPECSEIIGYIIRHYRRYMGVKWRDNSTVSKYLRMINSTYVNFSHSKLESPSRDTIIKFLELTKDFKYLDQYKFLEYVINLPVLFDRVINIEPSGMDDVYDLEVPVNKHFIAGGFVVHNSAVLVTIARVFSAFGKDSYLTTPQKILQDQYCKEFSEIPQIKGRSNYICADAGDPTVTCADGECQVDENYKCPAVCPYRTQRNICEESSICGMNTSYMMTVRKELFGERELFLCDEAHSVPEWAVGFVSVTIRESDVGMIPEFDAGFKAYILWLERLVYPIYEKKERELRELVKGFGKTKRKAMIGMTEAYKKARDIVKKIDLISSDYSEYGEDWLYDIVEDVKGKKIVFQPLTSGRFLKNVLWSRGSKIVLSSGTITPELFLQEGGLSHLEYNEKDCVITVPSEFPPEKSPIYYKAIGKMTNDKKLYTFPLIMKELNKLIADRIDKKGIVHCFSYSNAEYIVNNISPELRPLLWVQDKYDREGSLEKWMNFDEPSVFVSVNMTEGLNLSNERCRYQVYIKVGFPNTTDKRVAKRLELKHWVWYYLEAITDLEQASGRATRSKDDYSEMFIFDSSFATIVTKYGKFLKPWFKERLKFISNR